MTETSPSDAPACRGEDTAFTPPPDHWQADVVLADGGTAHLRPLGPDDRAAVVDLWSRISESSKYLRYFAAHPHLTEADLDALTCPDHRDHVGLALTLGPRIIAVAHYDVIDAAILGTPRERVANVSFLVEDAHQGRGAANILLEHLAQVGRERGVRRFCAEMLTQNRSMVQVFLRAGYQLSRQLEDGNIVVDVSLDPTEQSRQVMATREHRAESSAIAAILSPSSVAVVGAAAQLAPVVTSLTAGGFTGRLAVNLHGADIASSPAEDLAGIGGQVDLVVARAADDQLEALVVAAAERGARGLLLLAGDSYAPLVGPRDENLVRLARSHGIRVLGPRSLGVVNTAAPVRLNTSPVPMPTPGTVGLLAQSSGVAAVVLGLAVQRDLGLSNVVATGALADVTANDVMQFWCSDEATTVCLASLDSVGNPRKFFRILRRLAQAKPVVVFTPSRALASARGNGGDLPQAPASALDQVVGRTGAMVVPRREAMIDVASLLSRQPAPRGRRIRVVTNSSGLAEQLVASAHRFGLSCPSPVVVTGDDVPTALARATEEALSQPGADAVVAAVIEVVDPVLTESSRLLEEVAATTTTVPLVGVLTGPLGDPQRAAGRFGAGSRGAGSNNRGAGMGTLPVFTAYGDALAALALIADNAERRDQLSPGDPDPELDVETGRAHRIVEALLDQTPQGRLADHDEATRLLACYGIELVGRTHATTLPQAQEAAEALGWQVVLKAAAPSMTGRADTVFTQIADAEDMTRAWHSLGRVAVTLGTTDDEDPSGLDPVVQTLVGPGTAMTLRGLEDEALGPMVGIGVAGPPVELLDDLAWAAPPLRHDEAVRMLDSLAAAPLLHGHRGTRGVDLDAVADLVARLARLKDDLPQMVEVDLDPVVAGVDRTWVLGARVRVSPRPGERDPLTRRAT